MAVTSDWGPLFHVLLQLRLLVVELVRAGQSLLFAVVA